MTTITAPALTDQTPAQIDEQLDDLGYRHFVASDRAARYQKMINDIAAGTDEYAKKHSMPRYQETLDGYIAECEEAAAKIAPLNAEFSRRGGWTRAFLAVTNGSGGHVHRNRRCTSCYDSTQYAWMTEFSGMDEAEIVDAAGERACTYCYPTAPVSVLNKPTRMFTKDEIAAQQAREERAAKKVAAAAAVVAHPVTGKVLFKTDRAAANAINAAAYDILHYGANHPSTPEWIAEINETVPALAAKTGRSEAEILAEARTKAAKKVIKGLKGWEDSFIIKQLLGRGQTLDELRPEHDGKTVEQLVKEAEGLF